ncbi:M16 family metallopeptidase [Actinomyces vulturis]|uniref:M16 family metallopeptidase n=1 Tax=Actinomyces vulturis TaxID=1857645 RepID=UPI000830BC7A|nr:pitrilysin family protein [Actinomyces vulturis]
MTTTFSENCLINASAGTDGTELNLIDDGAHIRRSILPGGVRVITEHVPGLRSASLGMWFGVGSRDELAGHEGSTHFLEHLLFKGTPTRDAREIARAFDFIGGESNAATSKEHTSYYARVQGHDVPQALDIVTDMVTSSVLDPHEVATERGVIVAELAESADDPGDVAHEAFARAVFGTGTPLGRPVGGTPATVQAVSRDAIWEHYKQTYASDSLVVAVAGVVDHDAVCEQIARHVERAGWSVDPDQAPRARRSELLSATVPVVHDEFVARETEQAHLYVGCAGIPSGDERRWSMSMLTTILGGGMSSRLFQEIREKRGLAYSTYAFDVPYADSGAFGMYAGCAPKDVSAVYDLLVGEFERMAADGVDEEELARARGQLRGAMVLGSEDSLSRMGRLGRAEVITGRLRSMDYNLELLDAVTAEDIQQLAAFLASQPRCRVLVGPEAN